MKRLILTAFILLLSFKSFAGEFEDRAQQIFGDSIQSLQLSGQTQPGETIQSVLSDVGDLVVHAFSGFPFGSDDDDDTPYVKKIKSMDFTCQPPSQEPTSECVLKIRYLKNQGVDYNLSYHVTLDSNQMPASIVDNNVVLTRLH